MLSVPDRFASLWGSGRDRQPMFRPSLGARRVRRGSDVVSVLWLAVAIYLLGLVAVPTSGFEKALIGLIDAVPKFLDVLWRLGNGALVGWIVVLVVMTTLRRRFAITLDIVLSLVVTAGAGVLLAHVLTGDWPSASEVVTGGKSGLVPAVGLATGVAVSAAVAPQLTRVYRAAGSGIVLMATTSTILLGATTPIGGVLALSLGVLGATVVRLALGAQEGDGGPEEIVDALSAVGLHVEHLVARTGDFDGVDVLDTADDGGRSLVVRAYGRDARDTQLLATLWRAIVYRGGAAPSLSPIQQVEHEAFTTLMAASRGLPVPEVLAAGRTDSGRAVVVLADVGAPLPMPTPEPDVANDATQEVATAADLVVSAPVEPVLPDVAPDVAADSQLSELWGLIDSLHRIGFGMGRIDIDSFATTEDGHLQFADLRDATAGPTPDMELGDLAQVLVVSAVLHGSDRAVVAAAQALGPDGLERILAYLQPAALTSTLRHQLDAIRHISVDDLRTLTAAAAGVEPPKLARLRRVSPATLMKVGLLTLIAVALITTLGDVSIDEVTALLSDALWGWVIGAVIIGQFTFVCQAVAARGACPRPIALGPLAMLQFAIGFINLAIPSSAARIALDVRFFQRQGVPAASALSIAAIDGFTGFLVQVSLLLATLVFGLGQVDLTFNGFGSDGSDSNNLLWISVGLLVLAVLAAIIAVVVPKLRHRIRDRVAPLLGQVFDTLRSLRSPAKFAQLLGGILTEQIVFALTLGLCLHAFGGSLNLATLIVVYVAAALFGGFMPIPGGIGVVEAAITAGLVAAGIDSTVATASAVLFRLITFYLPPIWGWFAFSWLQKKKYL